MQARRVSGLPIRQRRSRLFGIGQYTDPFTFKKITDGGFQTWMPQIVPRARNDRFKTAYQLVFSLSARIKTLNTVSDGLLHALIKTRLEVQAIVLGQATPVAPI